MDEIWVVIKSKSHRRRRWLVPASCGVAGSGGVLPAVTPDAYEGKKPNDCKVYSTKGYGHGDRRAQVAYPNQYSANCSGGSDKKQPQRRES